MRFVTARVRRIDESPATGCALDQGAAPQAQRRTRAGGGGRPRSPGLRPEYRRSAQDKAAYLDLAGIPRELPCSRGGPPLKLVDVRLIAQWQVGTASPSFGSRELSYLPFPGAMISERTNLEFVYVSLQHQQTVDLRTHLASRS